MCSTAPTCCAGGEGLQTHAASGLAASVVPAGGSLLGPAARRKTLNGQGLSALLQSLCHQLPSLNKAEHLAFTVPGTATGAGHCGSVASTLGSVLCAGVQAAQRAGIQRCSGGDGCTLAAGQKGLLQPDVAALSALHYEPRSSAASNCYESIFESFVDCLQHNLRTTC